MYPWHLGNFYSGPLHFWHRVRTPSWSRDVPLMRIHSAKSTHLHGSSHFDSRVTVLTAVLYQDVKVCAETGYCTNAFSFQYYYTAVPSQTFDIPRTKFCGMPRLLLQNIFVFWFSKLAEWFECLSSYRVNMEMLINFACYCLQINRWTISTLRTALWTTCAGQLVPYDSIILNIAVNIIL